MKEGDKGEANRMVNWREMMNRSVSANTQITGLQECGQNKYTKEEILENIRDRKGKSPHRALNN